MIEQTFNVMKNSEPTEFFIALRFSQFLLHQSNNQPKNLFDRAQTGICLIQPEMNFS